MCPSRDAAVEKRTKRQAPLSEHKECHPIRIIGAEPITIPYIWELKMFT
jgi:hypothetical protein